MGGGIARLMFTSRHRAHTKPAAKFIACLCILLTLAGCIPERQWKIPRISGTVKSHGQPTGGVKILITRAEDSCNEPLLVATTDAQGKFSYEGLREFGVGRIFVTQTQTFSVCLQPGSSPVVGLSRRFGAYSHVAVNCDLEKNAASTQEQLCTLNAAD
jgi:hypothetical protein